MPCRGPIEPVPQEMKRCTTCKKVMEARFFYPYKDRKGRTRLRSQCMSCQAANKKKRVECNKERLAKPTSGKARLVEQVCPRCSKLLPITSFSKNCNMNSGCQSVCRCCESAQSEKLLKAKRTFFSREGHKHVPPPSEKICSNCDHSKPIDDFSKSCQRPTGYHFVCKACHAAAAQQRASKLVRTDAQQLTEGDLAECDLSDHPAEA